MSLASPDLVAPEQLISDIRLIDNFSLLFPRLLLNSNGFPVARFGGQHLVAGSTTSTTEDLIESAYRHFNAEPESDFMHDIQHARDGHIPLLDSSGIVDYLFVHPTPRKNENRTLSYLFPRRRSWGVDVEAALYTQAILQRFMGQADLRLH